MSSGLTALSSGGGPSPLSSGGGASAPSKSPKSVHIWSSDRGTRGSLLEVTASKRAFALTTRLHQPSNVSLRCGLSPHHGVRCARLENSRRNPVRFQSMPTDNRTIHAGPCDLPSRPRSRDHGRLGAPRELLKLRHLERNGGERLAYLHCVVEELAAGRHVLLEVHADRRASHAGA